MAPVTTKLSRYSFFDPFDLTYFFGPNSAALESAAVALCAEREAECQIPAARAASSSMAYARTAARRHPAAVPDCSSLGPLITPSEVEFAAHITDRRSGW